MRYMWIFILGMVVVGAWYASVLINGQRRCYNSHQQMLSEILYNSQSLVAGMPTAMCQQSYETISSWEQCLADTDKKIPPSFLPAVKPVVVQAMALIRYGSKEIHAFKLEHDARCSGDELFLFFPPDSLRNP